MAWKKPSWVSNVQKAAQGAANTVAAPVKQVAQAVTKAVPAPPSIVKTIQSTANAAKNVVRPAAQAVAKEVGSVVNPVLGEIKYRADEAGKNPVIQNIGKKIQEGVQSVATKPQASAGGNPIDQLGGALQQGAQWVGNKFMDIVAPGTANRTPTTKIAGKNPLEEERSMKGPSKNYGTVGAADGFREKDFEGLQPLTNVPILDDANVNPLTVGIQKLKTAAMPSAPQTQQLPQEGITVASAGNTPVGQKSSQPTETALDRLLKKAKPVVDTVVEKGGKAVEATTDFLKEGTDNLVVKGFSSQFGDIATKEDIQRFREAEAKGDIAAMDRIRAEMRSRKKK